VKKEILVLGIVLIIIGLPLTTAPLWLHSTSFLPVPVTTTHYDLLSDTGSGAHLEIPDHSGIYFTSPYECPQFQEYDAIRLEISLEDYIHIYVMTESQVMYWVNYEYPDPPTSFREHYYTKSFAYTWEQGDYYWVVLYNPSDSPVYIDRLTVYGGNPVTTWIPVPYQITSPAAIWVAGLGIAMMAGGAVIAVVLGREEVVPQPPSEPQTGGPGEPRGGPPSEGPQEWT